MNKNSLLLIVLIALISCNSNTETNNISDSANKSFDTVLSLMPATKNFESTIDGRKTALYVLKNGNMQVAITNYGARVVSIVVPDKDGKATDVSVGYKSIQPYTEGNDTYFGAIVGRYGNRIAKGKFKLDGKEYSLATNNGANHLHGGNKGFSRVVWDAQQPDDSTLVLSYISKDGEEGYPGNLSAKVIYRVLNNAQLEISYEATTDKPTVLNLTNHTYFNLNGEGSGTINNHSVMINADNYTPVDSTLIPTGKPAPVKGTPFDFTSSKTIEERVNDSTNWQIKSGHGYDHNFVLNTANSLGAKAAEVMGDKSGIVMDIYTLEPGLQFYGGNFMNGSHTLKNETKDGYRTAFCMETQHYPNSPNQSNFPSTRLNLGQVYKSTTIYAFSVK